PDVRWIGNEQGVAGDPNWSTVDPAVVPWPGGSGAKVTEQLQHGDPEGTVWRPGETDVSIRPGWFWHPAEDGLVRSVDDLVGLYLASVGRNSKLLLNVPPTRDGVLHATDVARLAGMRSALDGLFDEDLAAEAVPRWRAAGERAATMELDLGRTVQAGVVDLAEDIALGQSVTGWKLEGWAQGAADAGWTALAAGTTVGYRRIERFRAAGVRRVRLHVTDAVGPPPVVRLRRFTGPGG
ncbi:MAG: alpha-L-fucosidase, partial [Gemmatimonadetes bacterium]|nr:alpha-L-fucosidase [Gemmatimonadota bacterium]